MEPKVAQRLLKSADGHILATYLVEMVLELDSVSDIEDTADAKVEVLARKRAIEKLKKILGGLLVEPPRARNRPSEYAV